MADKTEKPQPPETGKKTPNRPAKNTDRTFTLPIIPRGGTLSEAKKNEYVKQLSQDWDKLFGTSTPPESELQQNNPESRKPKEEPLPENLTRIGYTREFIRIIREAGYSVNERGVIEPAIISGMPRKEAIITKTGTRTEFEPNSKDPIINVENTGDGWVRITRKHSPEPTNIRVESIPSK